MAPEQLAQIEATIRDAVARATASGMVIEHKEFGVGFSEVSSRYEPFPPKFGACRLCPIGAVMLKRLYVDGFVEDARNLFQLSSKLDVWAFFDGFDGKGTPWISEFTTPDTLPMYNLGKKFRDEHLAKTLV